jgi:hypothetical protein
MEPLGRRAPDYNPKRALIPKLIWPILASTVMYADTKTDISWRNHNEKVYNNMVDSSHIGSNPKPGGL